MPATTHSLLPPTNVRRVFWNWTRPILDCAVEELTTHWKAGTLDLTRLAVIVPTAQAGRMLRRTLAHRVQRLLPPVILTPDQILHWAEPGDYAEATPAQSLLAWVEVLQKLNFNEVPHVFPRPPTHQDFSWALQTAATFRKLLDTLGDGGWSINQATKRFGSEFTETQRWQELSSLEARYEKILARRGLADRNRVRSLAAGRVKAPDGITKISMMAVPDPMPLAKVALETLAASRIPIDIYIHAPASRHSAFDAWGEPIPDEWNHSTIPINFPEQQIRILQRPQQQAEEVARICAAAESPHFYSLGVVDPEVLPLTIFQLEQRGIPVFDPEGTPLTQHPLYGLLMLWQELLAHDSWHACTQFLRIPDILALVAEPDERDSLPGLLDEFQSAHLPTTLTSALQTLQRIHQNGNPVDKALSKLQSWIDPFMELPFDKAVSQIFKQIYPHATTANGFVQAGEHLLEQLATVTEAAADFSQGLKPSQRLHLLLNLLKEITLFPDQAEDRIVISGWLELAWQNEPGLIVAGLNEGMVPSSITSDPWIPHSSRHTLRLKTNEARFARDAYLLTALLESRSQTPQTIHLLLGRANADAEALTPSRLLLSCPRTELAARVRFLFEDTSSSDSKPSPPWSRPWRLIPRIPEDWRFKRISTTSFGKYLECPFRFFLQYVLQMKDYDPLKQEMDHFDFGNLCHYAFERLARDDAMKSSTDIPAIAGFLREAAASRIRTLYGNHLSMPLVVQQTSIQQRLTAAAPLLAQSRSDGWEIRFAECRLEQILGHPWMLNEIEVRGQIDLVEYHPERKCWRILDYKTSAEATLPHKAHLRAGELGEHQIHWTADAAVSLGGKPFVWTNLQLPLYAAALESHYQQPVEAAYFNLPPAVSQVQLAAWPELIEENLAPLALQCARSVIESIKNYHFWPPNPKAKFDDYERLFIRGAEESIDATPLLADAAIRRSQAVSP